MPLLGGHLKGGLKAHELTRRSSPYDIMAILIFASPEGAGQRASEVYLQWREKYIFSGERRYLCLFLILLDTILIDKLIQ